MGKVQNKSTYSKYWNTLQALHKTDDKTKTFSTFPPFKGCTTSGSTGLIMEWNSASSSKQDHPCCYAYSSFHVKYQYDLCSVKKKSIHTFWKRTHKSEFSQKHANYPASLQKCFCSDFLYWEKKMHGLWLTREKKWWNIKFLQRKNKN